MSLSATDLWRFILVLLNLLDTSARVWCEESETAYVQVLNYFKFIKQHFPILYFDDDCNLKKQQFPDYILNERTLLV